MNKALFTALVVVLIVIGSAIVASPLTRTGLMRSKGSISEGSFLGINIGESASTAGIKIARMGFRTIESSYGRNCMGIHYPEDYHVVLYYDNSWRNGTICVASIAGRVRGIRWYYDFLSP
jgi:uncharacterized membrane protein